MLHYYQAVELKYWYLNIMNYVNEDLIVFSIMKKMSLILYNF